jgi:hypothetical protein
MNKTKEETLMKQTRGRHLSGIGLAAMLAAGIAAGHAQAGQTTIATRSSSSCMPGFR